jgi:very-short-patch-repair endonuclease
MAIMGRNLRTRTGGVTLWAKLKPVARTMRREPTSAEAALWEALRDRKLAGARFRRQQPSGRFIVDFYCAEARLILEVDGPIHEQTSETDAARERSLAAAGFHMLRFTNHAVLKTKPQVLRQIAAFLQQVNRAE